MTRTAMWFLRLMALNSFLAGGALIAYFFFVPMAVRATPAAWRAALSPYQPSLWGGLFGFSLIALGYLFLTMSLTDDHRCEQSHEQRIASGVVLASMLWFDCFYLAGGLYGSYLHLLPGVVTTIVLFQVSMPEWFVARERRPPVTR